MDFGSNYIANIIATFSLLVSALVAILYFRDRRHIKFGIETEYLNRLLSWHAEVIEILMRLKSSAEDEKLGDRKTDLAKLSALIEQGRFFFPNIQTGDGFGDDKPPAYRGYRNLALDMLVASYNLHNKQSPTKHLDQAETLHHHFTSIVFEIIRPEDRLNEIKAITKKYFAQKKSFDNFLDKNDPSAIEFIWDKTK